jgi:hypothetical protein
VKGAGGGSASAPVTITVDRKMSRASRQAGGGVQGRRRAALRKALAGPPTGTVRIGTQPPTPTRITIERVTGAAGC